MRASLFASVLCAAKLCVYYHAWQIYCYVPKLNCRYHVSNCISDSTNSFYLYTVTEISYTDYMNLKK